MNLQRLEYFLVLARTGNFTRAAEELYITQPALSKQIAIFEQELGIALLNRTTKSVKLTDAGKYLAEEGQNLIAHKDELIRELQKIHDSYRIPLSIGTATSWAEKVLANIFAKFEEKHPEATLNLRRMSYSSVLRDLDYDKIQLGILRVFGEHEVDKYASVDLHRSHTAVVCSRNHPFASLSEVSVPELKNSQIMLLNMKQGNYSVKEDTIRLCERYGFHPNIREEPAIIETVYFSVSTGKTVSLLADDLKEYLPQDLVMVPLKDAPVVSVKAVWRKSNHDPLLREFVSILPFEKPPLQ